MFYWRAIKEKIKKMAGLDFLAYSILLILLGMFLGCASSGFVRDNVIFFVFVIILLVAWLTFKFFLKR